MPYPLHLSIRSQTDGSWRIALGHRDLRPVEGVLPAEKVQEILSVARERLSPEALPVVLVPGADADCTEAEEDVGRALAEVFNATPEIAATLAWQLGAAQERRELAVVAVDATDPRVRGLPWELLAGAGGQGLEGGHYGLVARLAAGRPVTREREELSRVEAFTWCPDPDDVVSAELLTTISRLAEQLGLERPRVLDVDTTLESGGGAARLLHIICHGRSVREQVELLVGSDEEGRVGAGTALHLLAPVLSRVDLVLLHICEGGSATDNELDGLPARFLQAGAPACVAATSRLSLETSQAFLRALYPALVSGSSLASAVTAGRRAVRRLALPHPDSRWHNQVLFVGDLGTVARERLVQARWRPEGWPQPGPEAARLLDGAYRLACKTGSGFVGLEHLALALARMPAGATGLERVRFQLGMRREHFRDYLGSFVPAASRSADMGGTLRLREYAGSLSSGFSLQELWAVITADRQHFLREMLRSRLGPMGSMDTVQAELTEHSVEWLSSMDSPIPVGALQVVGGPEDGRLLNMQPGEMLGRWSAERQSEHTLYEHSVLVDRALSRQHLRWLGSGKVELRSRSRAIVRQGIQDPVGRGVVKLFDGDLLQLSRATWLRALTPSPEGRAELPVSNR